MIPNKNKRTQSYEQKVDQFTPCDSQISDCFLKYNAITYENDLITYKLLYYLLISVWIYLIFLVQLVSQREKINLHKNKKIDYFQ